MLSYLQTTQEQPVEFDREAIRAAYQNQLDQHPLSVKILSVLGGLLASIAFLGFLFLADLFNSGTTLLIFGMLGITAALLLSKNSDTIILDTFSVSSFVVGVILTGFGISAISENEDMISLVLMVIGVLSLLIVQKYILAFISCLLINACVLALIVSNNIAGLFDIYVAALALGITFLFLREPEIITRGPFIAGLYYPVRTGLLFSFLPVLLLRDQDGLLPGLSGYGWLPSAICLAIIIYVVFLLTNVLDVRETKHRWTICVGTIAVLIPTLAYPPVPGAVLVVLLSFFVNHRTGFVLGMIAFIYFISRYYYDLDYSLLTKSLLMLTSGILFLLVYLFMHKKLGENEKV